MQTVGRWQHGFRLEEQQSLQPVGIVQNETAEEKPNAMNQCLWLLSMLLLILSLCELFTNRHMQIKANKPSAPQD